MRRRQSAGILPGHETIGRCASRELGGQVRGAAPSNFGRPRPNANAIRLSLVKDYNKLPLLLTQPHNCIYDLLLSAEDL